MSKRFRFALLQLTALGIFLLPVEASTGPNDHSTVRLAPDFVTAAFEYNLITAGQPLSRPGHGAGFKRLLSEASRDSLYPVELASAFGEDVTAIFESNLSNAIQVALTPTISLSPQTLSLTAAVGAAPAHHLFQIDSLGGTTNWNANVTLLNGSGWLAVSPSSGSATAAQPSTLTVDVNYAALGSSPGVYQALLTVTDIGTGYAAKVPISAILSANPGRLVLSQSSFTFTVAAGGSPPPARALSIFNAGQGTIPWSIPASAIPNWLNVSQLAGTSDSNPFLPPAVTLTVNNANAQTLNTGIYQALIPVSSAGASNDPQLFTVTLEKIPATVPPLALIEPNGLLFIATQGGSSPTAKNLTVSNIGGGVLTAQFTSSTDSGGNWLGVNPSGGSTTSGPLNEQVSVDTSRLSAGIFHGKIQGVFPASGPQEIDVWLIVAPPGTLPQTLRAAPAANACTPQSLVVIPNTIGNGTPVLTSFPKVLTISVVDSCGALVTDADILAAADGVPIILHSFNNGTYTGTWTPQGSGAITLTFKVLYQGIAPVTVSYSVSATASASGVQPPQLFDNGVVDGAGFTPLRPLSPGGIISLFGVRLGQQQTFSFNLPLPTQLSGVSVRMGSQDIPLYFASTGQINGQVPFEVKPGDSVPVAINVNGLLTAPQNYIIAPAQPAIFSAGTGAAILDGQSNLVTPSNPAQLGDTLQIFATGLGSTNPPVASGVAAPSFTTVTSPVKVTVGGVDTPVVYQGLAPGFVGLYQVNIVLPDSIQPGDAVPVVITQNGISSNSDSPVTIPVRQP